MASPYLHVSECVESIHFAVEKSKEEVNTFNIGSKDTISATWSGEVFVKEIGISDVEFTYTSGRWGWKGDVPRMRLGIDKLKILRWNTEYTSERSVRETTRNLLDGK